MSAAAVACRLCGAALRPRAWGGCPCEACGSVNVTEVPDEEALSRFYAGYGETYRGGGGHLERYARRYLQLVRRHVRAGRLLDVGCSNNPFPDLAQRAGFGVHVLDYVRPAALGPEVGFSAGSLSSALVRERFHEPFDVVTAWAVLEHVPDPPDAIRALCTLVRPGGWCLVMVPEQGTALTDLAAGRSPWFYPPEHLHLPSPRALERAFVAQGLRLRDKGRFELNAWRYAARYGAGLAEAAAGAALRTLRPSAWAALRERRIHRFQGMVYLVLQRDAQGV